MFEKVLVANRGEIALRVIRACKELGIRTLAVYSEADIESLHVQLADESICIGPPPSTDSYLKIDRIMSAAEVGDVDAIHPGYGFLAENAHFAEVCESCKIKFIGPPASAMHAMGDKNSARACARKAGVSITPGSDGVVENEQEALKVAQSVGYVNAGTMEFLVDNEEHYYFIEMNTRIQVEHTITEEVYGCDLVKEQILIAAGERLSPHVAHAEPRLHAIQCRINAEDPERNFQPSPGRIAFYYAPGGRGVRVDSHAYTGYVVPPYYDSMIAKIITIGATRTSAIARMRRALDEYYITGIKTTVPFHSAIMRNADFRNGDYDTGFVERLMKSEDFEIKPMPARLHE